MLGDNFQNNAFLQPLRLKTYRGAGVPLFIGLLHLMTLILLVPVSLPAWLRVLLGVLVLVHAGAQWYRHRPGRLDCVREILLSAPTQNSPNGQWWLRSVDHGWVPATLGKDALLHSRLLLLRFHTESGEYCVPVVRSKINADGYRRLRVRLRQPVNSER